MSSRRPPRNPGQRFGPSPSGGADDSPAQTNLGTLLQRSMEAAQQTAQVTEPEGQDEIQAEVTRDTKLCANCWNASTFKDDNGRMMARCAKNLWLRAAFTVAELNANKVRRWYGDCPEYDDSE